MSYIDSTSAVCCVLQDILRNPWGESRSEEEAKNTLWEVEYQSKLDHYSAAQKQTDEYRALCTLFHSLFDYTYGELGYEYAIHTARTVNQYVGSVQNPGVNHWDEEYLKNNLTDDTHYDLADHSLSQVKKALIGIIFLSIAIPFFLPVGVTVALSTVVTIAASAAAISVTENIASFFDRRKVITNHVLEIADKITESAKALETAPRVRQT